MPPFPTQESRWKDLFILTTTEGLGPFEDSDANADNEFIQIAS